MQFLLLDPAEILRIGSYRCMIDGGSCYFEFALEKLESICVLVEWGGLRELKLILSGRLH